MLPSGCSDAWHCSLDRVSINVSLTLRDTFVRATVCNVNGYMSFLEGVAKVGDVLSYFSKVMALLTICQNSLCRARVGVVKRDPLEDILRRIPEQDNGGI